MRGVLARRNISSPETSQDSSELPQVARSSRIAIGREWPPRSTGRIAPGDRTSTKSLGWLVVVGGGGAGFPYCGACGEGRGRGAAHTSQHQMATAGQLKRKWAHRIHHSRLRKHGADSGTSRGNDCTDGKKTVAVAQRYFRPGRAYRIRNHPARRAQSTPPPDPTIHRRNFAIHIQSATSLYSPIRKHQKSEVWGNSLIRRRWGFGGPPPKRKRSRPRCRYLLTTSDPPTGFRSKIRD